MFIVDNHLLCKLCPEIVETEVCVGGSADWNIIGDIASEGPGILQKMFVEVAFEQFAGGENSNVINQRGGSPESSSTVGADDDFLYRGIFEGQAW